MNPRIGVYLCHCGINIIGKVRVKDVGEYVSGLRGVALVRDYKFMCSDPGQELIVRDIRDNELNRVVVASCSPRLHEKTFQTACRRAGLNPFYFQMASIREQVSWVTQDPDEATDKAKSIVAAAVARVVRHEALSARVAEVHPDVMVVGGGIAGIQAALDVADAGNKVYLVERSPTIGGHMLQFDKTFPTLDCAACIGTPKMVEVAQHPDIELLTYSEVKEIKGYIGNYHVKVLRKPRYVKEGICTGCGECASVCPVLVPNEWDEGLSTRKAIYRSFPQAAPITFCIDKKDRPPCVTACPAGVNVQGYVQLIREGKHREAVELIMNRLPLPGVLGRVCPHPCEDACRRSSVDAPVAVRELKRFATDQSYFHEEKARAIPERPEKVAVIGAGPAGLTAAYYLRLKGFSVTIFEALDYPGGMLKVGIPDYRLPSRILEREIGFILGLGVDLKTGRRFGRDVDLDSLKADGYGAVFLGIGAHRGISLDIPGERDAGPGVIDAVRLLREINLGTGIQTGKKVCVIGGGNVAIDAARSILRSGGEAAVVYRRTRADMPAYPEEVSSALEEGVELITLATPKRIVAAAGSLSGLECLRNDMGPPDDTGRRRPVPLPGSEFILACDTVIPAIGQRVEAAWASAIPQLNFNANGTIQTDPETMQTSIPGVFAAGDAVYGPATVVEAVASAHRAVDFMERYLNGEKIEASGKLRLLETKKADDWPPPPADTPRISRMKPPKLPVERAVHSFDEVEQAFTEQDAQAEAGRCLNCGVCSECMECVKVCEAQAIDHTMQPVELDVRVGSIIVATGFDLFGPQVIKQYGYGRYPNVFTSLEFERINNATGPTGGEILMRDRSGRFCKPPDSVAIIHCVGSRDKNHHEYCSRVCCMYALKYGHLIHEKVGHHTRIHDFYIDMRCFGKGYEEFYQRCQQEGIDFTRGKPAEIIQEGTDDTGPGKLVLIGEDTLLGKRYRIPVDMVVLCAAVEARKDAAEVGRIFGLSQGRDGFFLEQHPKLAPVSTATDGVFLAGVCQAPRDVPDTVAQASGAASKALALAGRGTVEISPTISWINPDICAGCRTCIGLCPYSAIEFDDRRGVSVVNEAVCKGCGACAGACPSGAAGVRHFSSRQIFAEINGILSAVAEVGR